MTNEMPAKYNYDFYMDTAGIKSTKWQKSKSAFSLLIFNARERGERAVSDSNTSVKAQQDYLTADAPIKKQMLEDAKQEVIDSRTRNGVHWGALARRIGHEESGGRFVFEKNRQSRAERFQEDSCELCGLVGHDVPVCIQYLAAQRLNKITTQAPARQTLHLGAPFVPVFGTRTLPNIGNHYNESLNNEYPVMKPTTFEPTPDVLLRLNQIIQVPTNTLLLPPSKTAAIVNPAADTTILPSGSLGQGSVSNGINLADPVKDMEHLNSGPSNIAKADTNLEYSKKRTAKLGSISMAKRTKLP